MTTQRNGIVFTVILLFYFSGECRDQPNQRGYEKFIPPVPDKLKAYAVPTLIKGELNSFSGFLDGINEAKMFFWYFPSESHESDPLIVWLQGDIGISSVQGLFQNNGPFYAKTKKLNLRKHYWSQKFNMLYLDTSTETGFSHANSAWGFPKNMSEFTNNLLTSLQSFFKVFDHLRTNDVYIAGDGFACQIITKLVKKIGQSNVSFKMKGLMIENGFCDPTKALSVANYFFSLRIIDSSKHNAMLQVERKMQALLQKNNFDEAFNQYDEYIKGILTPYKTLFQNYTYHESTRNLLDTESIRTRGNYKDYIIKEMVKQYLRIPKELGFSDGKLVLNKLKGELMKNSMTDLGTLLNKYRVLMYYGQTNPEITPNSAYNMASSLQWCGGEFFEDVNYTPWFVNNILAGYIVDVRTGICAGSLSWALVRNAGKEIADERREEVLDLISKFVRGSLPRAK